VATVDHSGRIVAHSSGLTGISARVGKAAASMTIIVAGQSMRVGERVASGPASNASSAGAAIDRPSGDDRSLFSGYSPVSPHWPHLRTMATDFYYKWTPSERAWAGQHYDFAMGGNVSAWKTENRSVQHYRYILLQAVILRGKGPGNLTSDGYVDMQGWYSTHRQYRIESAFLHQAGQPADSAHRLMPFGWDSYTWIFNPADSGQVAYARNRVERAAEGEDGIFIDSQGSGDLMKNVKGSAEFPDAVKWPPQPGPFFDAYAQLLASVRQAISPKVIMINSSGYNFPPDFADISASGATHMEKANNTLNSNLPATWGWIDKLLSAGVFVDLVTAQDYSDIKTGRALQLANGSIDGAYQRLKMSELASYYMVVPKSPDRIALQLLNTWDHPYSQLWLKAQEANIGHPTEARRRVSQDVPETDPTGQKVLLFERDFDRALVVFRAQTGWGIQRYDAPSAVTVALPKDVSWLPLHADGTVGSSVASVSLRNAEAVILIKGAKSSRTIPTS
jgi:hypothetical protein